MPRIVDHGAPARVSECRGAIATRAADGRPVVLMTLEDEFQGRFRASLLIVDALTGASEQFWYPERDVPNGASFCCLLTRNGRFYTLFGPTFLEFDLAERRWTFAEDTGANFGMSLTEGPDGVVYAGIHPSCDLLAFDPGSRRLTRPGRLDPEQDYPNWLAADGSGWVYAGIGTAKANLVALNPRTGERRPLVPEADRDVGSARVYTGEDGRAYGQLSPGLPSPWLRLSPEGAEPVERPAPPAVAAYSKYSYEGEFRSFGDGAEFRGLDAGARCFEYVEATGASQRVVFDYESNGALITTLVAGPGGRVYGSTCHPMRFFRYDPATDGLTDLGALKRVGAGNFCGLSTRGDTIYGAAYCGGWFYRYDTTRPWRDSDEDGNPKFLGAFGRDILRPRTALAHPDGRHALMAGYPENGRVGGGMAIYDNRTGATALLTHEDLVPLQSTITLRALPDGAVVGGSSVSTPCGGRPLADEARLYIMEWPGRAITFETVPVSGARGISSIEVGPDGRVFGITVESRFFVFDPAARRVVHEEDFLPYGSPVRPSQSLLRGPDGRVYVLLTGSILRIDPADLSHEKIANLDPPARSGSAVSGGRLYYATGANLRSCAIGD